MFTIRKAEEITGIPAATLRSWEQRYGIGKARRSQNGYRVYDQRAIDEIISLQRLAESGWSYSEAAKSILEGSGKPASLAQEPADSSALELTKSFLEAARSLDSQRLTEILDQTFSRGSFEYVVDNWLFPSLRALGEEWTQGRMDIAAEHFASNSIMRRLGASYEAAGIPRSKHRVLVGTPAGSFHEMGALALATAIKRLGTGVIYLGVNVPTQVWVDNTKNQSASAAIISVVTEADQESAQNIVNALNELPNKPLVVVGGSHSGKVVNADLVLKRGIGESAAEITRAVSKL